MALTAKEIRQVAKTLHVSPNSIIAIQAGSDLANTDSVNALAAAIGKAGIRNVFIIVVDHPENITAFDPAAMAKAGWYRAETFGKVVARMGKKNGKA